MALTVTEDWIRERVGLKHNNLEDVRSLALPGTYHEKISALGESLRQFSRLKSLDLSRNALESISGVENLKLLEKLNLYYNAISSLQELYRLRYNQNLQELDLRLNPVARNEPDYRLFLIHMLPSLRRLDDRAVRDSERKAALMHFSTDQATELSQKPAPAPQPAEPQPNPRVTHVQQLGKPPAVLDEDDTRVFEYLNPDRGTLTGSRAKEPSMEEYRPERLRQMNMAGMGLENAQPVADPPFPEPIQPPGPQPLPPTQAYQPLAHGEDPLADIETKYPHLASLPSDQSQAFAMHTQPANQNKDPNLKYTDEVDAYTSYTAKGHFTPNPGEEAREAAEAAGRQAADAAAVTLQQVSTPSGERGVELYTADDLEKDLEKLKGGRQGQQQTNYEEPPMPFHNNHHQSEQAFYHGAAPAESQHSLPPDQLSTNVPMPGDFGEAIEKVSDLVDKYWNGSKSLLKSVRFKNHMVTLLKEFRCNDGQSVASNASLEFEMTRLRHQLDKARDQNEQLKEQLFQDASGSDSLAGMDESKLRQSLIRAQRDVKIMKERVSKSMEEKRTLEERLGAGGESPSGAAHPQSSAQGTSQDLGRIAKENEALRQQINTLSIKLKAHGQMAELAAMLQQSHKSLVTTNEHLLTELDETRRRHKEQMQQMNYSYNQLRKTVMPQQMNHAN